MAKRAVEEKNITIRLEKGYSQHMIAKVLEISQQAVFGVVKRSKK
jgi:predicted transcriptional regulator